MIQTALTGAAFLVSGLTRSGGLLLMLALPEQVLSTAELVALTRWKHRYSAESRMEAVGMEPDEARRTAAHLCFLAWAYRTGRLSD